MDNTLNTNLMTLSHSIELASAVISRVAGEEVSNQLDGKLLSSSDLKQAVAAKMQASLSVSNGSAQ